MNIDNIALVRATNVIPFDGVMRPISETPYLKRNFNLAYSSEIHTMLVEEGLLPQFDWSKSDDDSYLEEYRKTLANIKNDYIPYNSDYNSMILFSLNGLVPDDSEVSFGNNTFSDKKCAVIDALSQHIDQVVSLVPTDTAVKGSIELSKDAIVLIEEKYYESLPDELKAKLFECDFEKRVFDGSLKEAVKETLASTGRYIPEELSLSRKDRGYRDSDTKEMTLATIDNIAKERDIAQVLHFDVLTGKSADKDKLSSVKDEYDNINLVFDYYQEDFYKYLFEHMPVNDMLQSKLLSNLHSSIDIKELCGVIKEFGLDNYKQIVMSYNSLLENKRSSGELLTPEEIVSLQRKDTITKK